MLLSKANVWELVVKEGAQQYPGLDIAEVAAQARKALAQACKRSTSEQKRADALRLGIACVELVHGLSMDARAKLAARKQRELNVG